MNDEPTELDLVYEDLRKAQARIKELEAVLEKDKRIAELEAFIKECWGGFNAFKARELLEKGKK